MLTAANCRILGYMRTTLSPEEERARQVLVMLMRLQGTTDQRVADDCHVSRSAIEARRAGDTRLSLKDVGLLSKALNVEPFLFSMEPDEALAWYAENRKELLRAPSIWTVPAPVAA